MINLRGKVLEVRRLNKLDYFKEYYKKNKDFFVGYRNKNRDKFIEYSRKYYAQNKDDINLKRRIKYRMNNK